MNYIIEGPKSFASLLNDDTTDNEEIADDVRCCLISGEPLGINHITLRCGHLFNYKPLYNELIQASAESNLPVYSIKCPYCREYTHSLLPYIPSIPGVEKIKSVNAPARYSMTLYKCQHIFKSGKQKGKPCNAPAFKPNESSPPCCLKHWKMREKKQQPSKKTQPLSFSELQDKMYRRMYRTYTLSKLKELANSERVSDTGRKKDIILRLILKCPGRFV